MNIYKIEVVTKTTKELSIKAHNLEDAYYRISKNLVPVADTTIISLKNEISYLEPIIKNNEFLKDKNGMVLSFFDIPRSELNNY